MKIIERLGSEVAYITGAGRALLRTTPIARHRTRTLRDLCEDLARRYADRPALASVHESFTYAGLNGRANQYARWMRDQGYGKGDVIALLMPTRPEYLAVWFETARDLLPSDVAIYVHGEPERGTPADMVRIDRMLQGFSRADIPEGERPALTIDDHCLYIYTSGTTGMPKAANLNHYRVQLAMRGFWGATGARASDRMYVTLPMYHTVGGVCATGAVLCAGGSVFIRERFSASEFWADIVREKCTMFAYVGELCRYLLAAPPSAYDRAHKLRLIFGNGLRPDVWIPFRDRFGIPRILEFYAATEGNVTLFNLDSRPGAVGRLPKWMERRFIVKIVRFDYDTEQPVRDENGRCIECGPDEVGEALGKILSDPSKPAARFEGYADKAATEKKILRDAFETGDAWFRSGDLVR